MGDRAQTHWPLVTEANNGKLEIDIYWSIGVCERVLDAVMKNQTKIAHHFKLNSGKFQSIYCLIWDDLLAAI